MTGQSASRNDWENEMLAYDVSPDSPWGCEVRGRLDDAAQWQARSMIARQGAAPKIEKKLMAMALGLLLGLPGLARADVKFTFTTIDVPLPPPAKQGTLSPRTAADANSPNAIAGEYDDLSGATHGFILRGSAYTTIDVPKQSYTAINGINAAGQLAGTYIDSSGGFHAFFSPSQGVFTTLMPPGSTRSQGGFLNSRGQVVGTYRTSDMKRHGFLWSGGNFINTMINVPGDDVMLGTVVFGINDPGQIVGDYVDATDHNRHGFLLSQGTYTKPLDPPGSSFTVAEGINNAGVIVGVYVDANGQHGFLLSNDVYTKVDVPDSTATAINSINARGQIAGSYDDKNGSTHGFVGTPAD
jgi:probable HAF family extracellular repeat protein